MVLAGFFGMVAVSLAGLNERRREIAVYRAVGASRRHVCALLMVEALLLTLVGIILGVVLISIALLVLQGMMETRFGLYVSMSLPSISEMKMLLGLFFAGLLAGMVPAFVAYRNTLVDGLSAKT